MTVFNLWDLSLSESYLEDELGLLAAHAGFILIDPTLEDAGQDLKSGQNMPFYSCKIRHPDMAENAQPYLLELPAHTASRLEILRQVFTVSLRECFPQENGRISGVRSICALIVTPLQAENVIKELNRTALCRDIQKQVRILRYWDPRIMQYLPDETDLIPLLPQLQATVFFLNADAQLMRIEWTPRQERTLPVSRILTDIQQQRLSLLSARNAVITRLGTDRKASITNFVPLVDRALRAADQAEFETDLDRHAFAASRCRLDCPIENSALLRQYIAQAKDSGASYSALECDISDEDWLQIQRQAGKANQN